MKTQLIATTLLALAAAASGPAAAQYLKPGLWQFSLSTPGQGDGFQSKACISSEQARDLDNLVRKDGNCTSQRSPLVGGQLKLNMSCTNPPATGSAVIAFHGDTGYTMQATMTGNMGGQRLTQTTTTTGKWLGSNCGKVKPDLPHG